MASAFDDWVTEFTSGMDTAQPGVTIAKFHPRTAQQHAMPRVCFVPRGGAFGAPFEVGPSPYGAQQVQDLAEDLLTVDAHVWATGTSFELAFEAVMALLHNCVVVALNCGLVKLENLGTYEFITQQESGGAFAQSNGQVAIWTFETSLRVPNTIWDLTEITGFSGVGLIELIGGSEVGC